MSLNLGDVQGNVLRGYKHMHFAAYLFCEFANRKPPRKLLRKLGKSPRGEDDQWPHVMSAKPWREKASVHEALNVALSYRGLWRLGWGEWFEDDRFEDFRQGMRKRWKLLGDPDPHTWQPELSGEVDLLFVVYAEWERLLEEKIAELEARLPGWGLTLTLCQRAATLQDKDKGRALREHFGFRDGFSQPVPDLEGAGGYKSERGVVGEGVLRKPWRANCWRPVRLGEFLLGHKDEDGVFAGGCDATAPFYNGTFMVWRKLEQDTVAFKKYFDDLGADGERLKAKVVGRWRDGTSLVDAPWAPPPHAPRKRKPHNAFSYAGDPDGARCPIGSHVRRSNPRASLGYGTERAKRHRIIRRGVPYTEGDRKGLIFVCFNASISRQFELIQGSWLMDGDAFGLGAEQDFLLGGGRAGAIVTIPGGRGAPARFLERGAQRFVRPQGGYYLLLPSRSALKRMGKGKFPGRSGTPGPSTRTVLVGAAVLALWPWRGLKKRGRVDHKPHIKLLGKLPRLPRK
ncbi:MAG TPA: hypothetical protein VNZ05_06040 [Solirubrobacteraceae bacterium]|jgi:Dyp-type peroxidase family|nr:hypothetical protein [Solirubrobacteraceae bacterium]